MSKQTAADEAAVAASPSANGSWRERWSIIGVIICCMIGVGFVSYFVLIHASLRLDESQSLWQTSHSIGDTLRVVAQDVHVPLYHVILHFWQLYLGNGVPMARLLSLVFFLLTIPLMYVLGRFVLGVRWALFATVIFSFAPFMDWYANEARMYTLLVFLSTISQIFFLRILQRKKRAWPSFGLSAIIGAYTHYFFMFNLATDGLYFLINRKKFAHGSLWRFIVVGVLVIASLAPWLVYFHSLGSGKNTSPLLNRPSTVDFFNVFSQFSFGFQDNYINTILVSCWPLVVLLAFFAMKRGQRPSPELTYLLTAGLAPVALAYILSFLITPFFLSRYMISCVAPLTIVLVWLMSQYGKRLAYGAASLVVIVLIVTSLQQDVSSATPVKEDYHDVAQTIMREAGPKDIVVLSAPFTIYPFEYYYHGIAQINTIPMWNRQATGAIPAFNAKTMPTQVKQLAANHRYVYLVLSQDQGYESTLKQYYLHHYREASHTVFSPDLTLYVFQVGYNQVPALDTPKTLIPTTVTQ